MTRKYTRLNYNFTKRDLINTEILELIKMELAKLMEKTDNILFYEEEKLFNSFTIARSHLVKSEIITTAQIEGSSLNTEELDLSYMFDLEEIIERGIKANIDNVKEVINSKNAISKFGELINKYAISNRSIKGLHKILFNGLSSEKIKGGLIGEFKTSSNKLENKVTGEVIFEPATMDILFDELQAFENFVNNTDISLDQKIINSGIVHAWFERIHPFCDGNGRVGRILIPFYLAEQNVTDDPIIFLSSEFKDKQTEYYDKLDSIQVNSDYKEWMDFYLNAFYKSLITTNKVIGDILLLSRNIKIGLQNSEFDFLRKNNRVVSNILIKNNKIRIDIFTKELNRAFKSELIEKVPSEQSIRKYLNEIKSLDQFKIESEKPLVISLKEKPIRKI